MHAEVLQSSCLRSLHVNQVWTQDYFKTAHATMRNPGRLCGTGGAYGRFIAHNGTVLEYEHVENPTGKVTDTWAIVKTKPTAPIEAWAAKAH